MSSPDPLGRAEQEESLRQKTLAFNQRHRHRERWFALRFAMGLIAVVTLPLICAAAAFVIFNYEQFGAKAVTVASGVLLTAIALLAAAWKRILADPAVAESGAEQTEPPSGRG